MLDPAALAEAVREVDFTPRGVTAWLRGAADDQDLPALNANESGLWLVIPGSGQRLLLVADNASGSEALEAVRRAPPGSITVFGTATGRAAERVTVRLLGLEE